MDFLYSSTFETKTLPTLVIISLVVGGIVYLLLKSTLHLHGKKLPAGSFGYPVIGESITFLRARKQDKVEEWLEKRVRKYGPLFKTSLFGSKIVVVTGQVGSRFVFQGGDNGLSCQQPKTIVRLLGNKNLFELSGARHKLIRGGIVGFFKPESIQRFVDKMDSLVQHQLLKELDGKDSVHIVNLMKKIAFDVAWSIFFGFSNIGEEKNTEVLLEDLEILLKGAQAIPINIPGTLHYNGIQASARIKNRLAKLVEIKKNEVELRIMVEETQDSIVSWLVNLRDENGEPLTDEEIVDNFLLLIFASHDTVASLTTSFIKHLATDDEVYNKVLQEQMEVMEAKRENDDGRVSWKEIQKMKYTWRVAQELMRISPPVPLSFRKITRDINFEGFDIPKGWQVLLFPSSTHMDEKIFEDPNKFDPLRFEKSYPSYTYVAFGGGPRICPGAEFGKIESMLVIHHMITKYEWEVMIPDEPMTYQPMPYPAMGLPVKFHLKNI